MLNEIKEYEQYTAPFETFEEPAERRLKYSTLINNHLGGLNRAMTIIARQFIFKDKDIAENFSEDTIKEILKIWCGFKTNCDIPEAGHLIGWLPGYMKQVLLGEAQYKQQSGRIKKIKSMLDNWEDKNKQFSHSMYPTGFNSKNDVNAITFERIIANAFHEGKLERYYLVCDINPYETSLVSKVAKTKVRMNDSDHERVLKATAYYLLQKRDSRQEYVFFNNSDFANWLLADPDPKDLHLEKYILTATGEPLFDKTSIGKNIIKRKIHPKWMEKFRLVKAKDIDNPENQGRIFFSDSGCGDFLQCNVKY